MSASIHAFPKTTTQPRPSSDFGNDHKMYYLIFSEGSPPAITDSFDVAEEWKKRGCEVETYIRKKDKQ